MYKIFLIILVFQYIKADKSNEKYIDLLPEEEKQEFLNRIARRILEEVNSPDIPNESHAEVNEEQLDAQNAYVKQIIKEESKTLQNEKRDDTLRNDQETNNGGDKNNVIDPHIDLTLRTRGNEEKNDSELNVHFDAKSELTVIPFIDDQENEKFHDNSAFKEDSNVNTQTTHDKNVTTKLGKGMKNKLITTNVTNDTVYVNNIRKSHDHKLILHTTITNFDPSSEESTTATEDSIIFSNSTTSPDYISNTNTTETDDKIIWISTKKIYDESIESIENVSLESLEITSTSNLTTTTDEEQVTTSSVTNSTLEPEESKAEITTLQPPDNSSNYNQSRSRHTLNKYLYVRSGASELKNELNSNITQLTHNALNDSKTNESDMNSVNKLNDPVSKINITNSNHTKSNTSDVRSIYLVNNKKENITELKVKDSHISLRASSASKETEIDTLKKHDLKSDVKEYEVFEVAADKPPFKMKPNIESTDTPYYIPVYNYAPDYAYFRPRSRFGPHEDGEDNKKKNNNKSKEVNEVIQQLQIDSPIIRSIFSGYNQREKPFYENKPGRYIMKKPIDNIFDLQRPIKNNNYQDIYYNPNDYLDLDYYYGRTNMKQLRTGDVEDDNEVSFPDTDDEDHPYHSIHASDSIKSHIRAVRKLLYLNQIYEPIPDIKRKEPRKFYDKRIATKNVDTKYHELRHKDADNIASDYYFGVIPHPRTVQAMTIIKNHKNKLLRNPAIKKKIETNGRYDKLNELKNNSNSSKDNKLDKMMEAILDVLRDFIRFDNQALLKYNWLESTVDTLAAIKKILELTTQLQFKEHIHPKDLELIKYIFYLYKCSVNKLKKETPEGFNSEETKMFLLKMGRLPKNKWNNKIRQPLKLWRDVAYYLRSNYQKERMKLLYGFEDFLQNVLFSLRDFHDAIKHIAIITKYNNQKWYDDLKNIYLHGASNEKLLTLLLHVSVTKLLNSIEKSATDGAENNFRNYMKNNKQFVQRSKEEFLFVLNILHELRRIKN